MPSELLMGMLRWLASPDSRRGKTPEGSLELALAQALQLGVPLVRVSTIVMTMHPEVEGRELVWWRGRGASPRHVPHGIRDTPAFVGSAIEETFRTGQPVRCLLSPPPARNRFPQLDELAAQGVTDYVAKPVSLFFGRESCVTYATDQPGGFTEAQLADLDDLHLVLSLGLDIGTAAYSLYSLLKVYLGQNAATRVMAGAFRRGQGTSIAAAIWFCDLRGFTAMSDSLPAEEVVATLDEYFEAVGGAVEAAGGEVLKFIGDAMLAVFPVRDGPREPCQRALGAAREALQALEQLNGHRSARGKPALRAGIALNLGEVMYGNIGARDRLDFTIIGRSVNEASRLESLCKTLGVPLLLSSTFVRALGLTEAVSLGVHDLRGLKVGQEVFTLPELAPKP